MHACRLQKGDIPTKIKSVKTCISAKMLWMGKYHSPEFLLSHLPQQKYLPGQLPRQKLTFTTCLDLETLCAPCDISDRASLRAPIYDALKRQWQAKSNHELAILHSQL